MQVLQLFLYKLLSIFFFTSSLRSRSRFLFFSSIQRSRDLKSVFNIQSLPIEEINEKIDMNWINDLKGIKTLKKNSIGYIDGVRGVIAGEYINENDLILTVPEDVAIETTNNRPPTPFKNFISQDLWEMCKWDQRICFKLLWEYDVLNKDSNKFSWLNQLPKSYDTTFYWTSDELNDLQYNSLVKKIEKQKKDWQELYLRWRSDCSYFSSPQNVTTWGKAVNKITIERFIWGLETVNSRSFSGVYEGSSAADRRSLFLLTGFLTLAYPVLGFGSYEQAIQGAIAVGISIFFKDYFFSKSAKLKRYVMCPYIDMFNHKSSSSSEASFNYFSGQFELQSQAHQVGDEIFINYGKQSNDRFLQYYGFVEKENIYDSYDFGLSMIELVFKYSDNLSRVVAFPSTPPPQVRLTSIASALQATNMQDSNQIGTQSMSSAADSTVRYFRMENFKSGKSEIVNHFDDISVRLVRALFCSESEWNSLTPDKSLQNMATPLSIETEKTVNLVLSELCKYELQSKTPVEDDEKRLLELNKVNGNNSKGFTKTKVAENTKKTIDDSFDLKNRRLRSALLFRIEKKKLLLEAIKK